MFEQGTFTQHLHCFRGELTVRSRRCPDTAGVTEPNREKLSFKVDFAYRSLPALPPPAKTGRDFIEIPARRIHADVGRYRLRLAESAHDREAACRLRFRVFNLELGGGLESSFETGLDIARFDTVCDLLLVEDATTRRVVGTYRMQSGETPG